MGIDLELELKAYGLRAFLMQNRTFDLNYPPKIYLIAKN
jgi:hypothetical protein